nr:gamma-interferon-inducible protein 16 isoform X1 [Globicephala melas]
MGSEFKRIVLLKGFQHISDYQFSMIKSLLAKDLRLTSKMQNDYDRIKIADLMEVKYPGAACVEKLIDLIKDIEEIKDLAKTLRKERLKVIRRSRAKEATPVKKSKLNKTSPDQSTSTTDKALGPESIKDTPVKGKKTTKTNESERMNLKKDQSQLPGLLITSTESTESLPQTPQMLPPNPSSSSSTKKKNDIATKINDLKRKTVSQKQSQLPGTSATSKCPTGSSCPVKSIPPPTPSSSFSVKEEENTYFWIQRIEDTTNKTLDSKKKKLCPEQSQLPQCANFSMIPNEGCLQTPQMLPPTSSSSSSTKKPKLKAVPKEASREEGFQRGPKEVMVLKATEPFTYDVREGERKMFHATVATESQFFQVKVYHVDLKEKFIPKKIIAISDYFGRSGFLEVFNASSVSDVNPDRKMEISKSLIQKANATPKISHLYSQALGTFVNGVFLVHEKLVRNECIYYEIQDNTGVMEVLVYGERLTRISCEKGDRLTLICFELAVSGDKRQLRSIIHSFIKKLPPPPQPSATITFISRQPSTSRQDPPHKKKSMTH